MPTTIGSLVEYRTILGRLPYLFYRTPGMKDPWEGNFATVPPVERWPSGIIHLYPPEKRWEPGPRVPLYEVLRTKTDETVQFIGLGDLEWMPFLREKGYDAHAAREMEKYLVHEISRKKKGERVRVRFS